MSITYTGSVGFQPECGKTTGMAGWTRLCLLYNKERELQGDSQVFTAEIVQKMRDGA
ncbi:hypothetical protein NXW37_29640 [Bacteroides thetaiotaomicron]|nr:hypothetical protein [Bacteroides thetaiotaomicron]